MNLKRRLLLSFLSILWTGGLSSLAWSQDSHPLPLEAPKKNFVHAPYGEGWCNMCHKTDSKENVIPDQFIGSQPELCYQCHDRKDDKKNVHGALSYGDCTSSCHTPHQSEVRFLLRDKVESLCVQCHDAPGQEQTNKHAALSMTKSCVRCHNAHSSDQKKLLNDTPTNLCIYCHKGISKELAAAPSSNQHAAVIMGCQACHNAHGSPNPKLLKSLPNQLCFECHDSEHFKDGHPKPGHPFSGRSDPLFPEKTLSCLSCHKPHISANEKLLRYRFKNAPYDGTICSVCHWQTLVPPPQPPRPKWND